MEIVHHGNKQANFPSHSPTTEKSEISIIGFVTHFRCGRGRRNKGTTKSTSSRIPATWSLPPSTATTFASSRMARYARKRDEKRGCCGCEGAFREKRMTGGIFFCQTFVGVPRQMKHGENGNEWPVRPRDVRWRTSANEARIKRQ